MALRTFGATYGRDARHAGARRGRGEATLAQMTRRPLPLARTACALAIVAGLWSPGTPAAEPPRPPCAGVATPRPAFPSPEAPPAIMAWSGPGAAADIGEPDCTGWDDLGGSRLVVALAGTFRFDGPLDGLLERLGRVGRATGVRYWSVSDKAWRPLVLDASALASADPRDRREDFRVDELRAGGTLHYLQRDNRSGEAVYRLRVRVAGSTAMLATENATPIRYMVVTAFPPSTLQTIQWIVPRGPGVWGAYILMRAGPGASSLADGQDAAFRNRATALFRHLAGIPTDREPPAAR
jgi:hypothetical protein